MKWIALETEVPQAGEVASEAVLQAEARFVWDLYLAGIVREAYFHANRHTAVLVLECKDEVEASDHLSRLPLVSAGHIRFELLPVVPYPGFGRLFSEEWR
jgi:hypothetical protein